MSRYQPYPAYKDSGVEWLGEVPVHWELTKLKRLASFSGGGTPSRDNPAFWNGKIPWVSPKDMKAELIEIAEEFITDEGLLGSSTSLVPPGRVLMVVRSGILKHTIPVAINNVAVALNQDMKALAFKKRATHKFFLRWVQGLNDELLLTWSKQGATVESIEQAYLAETVVPLPSDTELVAIATFLDRETTKLDTLIAKQEKLIELLQEKRQALISHAVTKGLHPDVPMKDSGVDWLGEVPGHWKVKRLKFVAQVQGGVAKGRDLAGQTTIKVPYLRVANVQDGYLDLNDVAEIEILEQELPRYSLQYGDVLMNEGGDFDKLGRGHVWRCEISPCIHQNHVFAVRPAAVEAEWLNMLTSSEYGRFYFMSRSKQSTNLASISATNIGEFPMVCPPENERKEITYWMEKETTKLDTLIEKSRRSIDLMREHRTALISAAVTGKIDVREAT